MLRSRNLGRLGLLTAFALVAAPLTAAPAAADHSPVFISEFHYDNVSTDTGEAIEVQAPVGTDLAGWSLELYNGSPTQLRSYGTIELSGVVDDSQVVVVPATGLQNGDPDGIALVDADGSVVEFLSYGGTFTPTDGPAAGTTSEDVGVVEGTSTPVGHSLQRDPVNHDVWTGPIENTFGAVNGDIGEPPPGGDVFISEIHYDNAGADTGEAIEVQAPEGTDLTGWSIVLYNGSNGTAYGTLALSGTVDASQVVVVPGPSGGIQNGSPDGLALVGAGNALVEFLSYEGTFTASGGPADGTTSTDIGVSQSGSEPAGQSLQKIDGVWTGPAPSSFGAVNEEPPPPDLGECGEPATLISEIQGSGNASPLVGQTHVVEAVVTAVKPGLDAYFVSEELEDRDDNPETSEGLFVFTGGADTSDLMVGDLVRVVGPVSEFNGKTELTDQERSVCGPAEAIDPEPVTFPLNEADDLEHYEGMLVELVDDMVISEYFNYDRFGEVVIAKPLEGDARLFTPTAVVEPGPEAVALAESYEKRWITLDDSSGAQNPEVIPHPGNGEPFTAENTFRGGDTVTGVQGVIDFAFGLYRIHPTTYGQYEQVNPRPTEAPDVGGDVQVASFNVLNYFLTLDQGEAICGPERNQDCRGANTAEELERQRTKILAALAALDADVVGLIEMENTPGVDPAADLAAGLNEILGEGTYASLDTGVIGTDAIRVGFLYKPDEVGPRRDFAILDSTVDPRFDDMRNRPMLTQTFVYRGGRFTVSVNHLKSKGSGCGQGDDATDGSGNCDGTRTLAAQAITDFLAGDPTASNDPDQLVIGDLNSYDHERPIDTLTAGGYTDLIKEFGGEKAYGYVFDGQVGYLDYGMSSTSLTPQVTGAAEWHINADEPDILDYNLDFGRPASYWTADQYRSSDHDAVLVGLDIVRPSDGGPPPGGGRPGR